MNNYRVITMLFLFTWLYLPLYAMKKDEQWHFESMDLSWMQTAILRHIKVMLMYELTYLDSPYIQGTSTLLKQFIQLEVKTSCLKIFTQEDLTQLIAFVPRISKEVHVSALSPNIDQLIAIFVQLGTLIPFDHHQPMLYQPQRNLIVAIIQKLRSIQLLFQKTTK